MTGNFPAGGSVPPGYGLGYPAPPKRSRAGVWLGAIACLLAAAAMVVAVVGLNKPATAVATSSSPTAVARPLEEELFVDEADKALCQAIAPLMREASDRTNAFLRTGSPESRERLDAIAGFKSETLEWAGRTQDVLNKHAAPPRYLTRTLQRYVDGLLLYSENMYKDRGPDPFDNTTYDSAIVALGGPLGTCYKVGVSW
jgi:hypothetical protein